MTKTIGFAVILGLVLGFILDSEAAKAFEYPNGANKVSVFNCVTPIGEAAKEKPQPCFFNDEKIESYVTSMNSKFKCEAVHDKKSDSLTATKSAKIKTFKIKSDNCLILKVGGMGCPSDSTAHSFLDNYKICVATTDSKAVIPPVTNKSSATK